MSAPNLGAIDSKSCRYSAFFSSLLGKSALMNIPIIELREIRQDANVALGGEQFLDLLRLSET